MDNATSEAGPSEVAAARGLARPRASQRARRAVWALMVCTIAGAVAWASFTWYVKVWHVPRLEIEETNLDLGDGKPSETLHGVFRLKNTGHAPLQFTAGRSCGCTHLSPTSGTIAPGQTCDVTAGVTLHGHANSERSVRIRFHSNDPSKATVDGRAAARCPAPFRVEPAFVNFGSLLPEQLLSARAHLRIAARPGGQRVAASDIDLHCDSKVFEFDAVESGGEVLVAISARRDAGIGDHPAVIDVQLRGTGGSVAVPVQLRVAEVAAVVPSTVVLHRDTASGEFEPVSLLLINRTRGLDLGEIVVDDDGPGRFELREMGAPGASPRRLDLVVAPGNAFHGSKDLQLVCRGIGIKLTLTLIESGSN